MTHAAASPIRDPLAGWRTRSRVIRTLRWALPLLMIVLGTALAGYFIASSIEAEGQRPREASTALKLTGARFMGRMEDGRSFLIGAGSARRSEEQTQQVILTDPILNLGGETGAPSRMIAKRGVYDEDSRILRLTGDVRIDDGAGQRIATNDTIIDTRSGKITGDAGIAGDGPLGQVQAKSYDVDRDTGRVIMKGGVRGRIEK